MWTALLGEMRALVRGELPLAVAVLIDLEWSLASGGHVLSWQRLAEAAVRAELGLDLTLHVQGDARRTVALSDSVRFEVHRPVLSSSRFELLSAAPDHSDLAPIHPALFHALGGADVIHTTDAFFAYARTARLRARLSGTPLVSSLHTDVPSYARLFTRRLLGGRLGRARIPDRVGAYFARRLARHLERSDWVLTPESSEVVGLPAERTSPLRRGIDRARFSPSRRDRARLTSAFGIPASRSVLLFVGRLDPGKRVMTFARAVRSLLDRGLDVHALFAGGGGERGAVAALLGERATLAGSLPQEELGWIYASSDVFVHPSEIELAPNVVLEAKASGLPVLVAPGGGDRFVSRGGEDGLVIAGPGYAPWAAAIAGLVADPERRRDLGLAARRDVEERHPSWDDVLRVDLLPIWRAVARGRSCSARAS